MKLPLSWLREFVTFPKNISLDAIVAGFVKVGFEVEGVENPASNIKGPLVVGKVESIEELTGLKERNREDSSSAVPQTLKLEITSSLLCQARSFLETLRFLPERRMERQVTA
jgi:hypothetical protein